MSEIPAEAVQAAAEADRKARCTHTLGSSCAECRALASLRAAAPFLAEHIAGLIRARGLEAALDCWCHDTYADLAREAFPKETPDAT